MSKSIEPLSPALWFQRIAIIADGELGSLENSLRHAGHLLQLSPLSFRKVLTPVLNEDEYESLLERGDLDEAARQLFRSTTRVLVEAGPDGGPRRAVIACDILQRAIDATGDTAARALLNAWARWLLTLRLELGPDLEEAARTEGQLPAALQARLSRDETDRE